MGKTIAIVGGGAAGLAAAISAGRALAAAHATGEVSVEVLEDDERIGRSILATGNGRCNFSNAHIDAGVYRNSDFVARTLKSAELVDASAEALPDTPAGAPSSGNAVARLFASCGLVWREEAQGRLLPVTNKASTVLDVLRAAAAACGASERCGNAVRSIELPRCEGARFTMRMADGSFERAEAVVVAVGGRFGLSLLPESVASLPLAPVLGPLKTGTKPIRALDNIRVRCAVELRRGGIAGKMVARERGELLFRKYGVSGIAVFNLSRFALEGDAVVIDFLAEELGATEGNVEGGPSGDETRMKAARAFLEARRDALDVHGMAGSCKEVLRGLALPLVIEAVCARAKVDPDERPAGEALERLARMLRAFALRVEGIGDARQCQVHRGGIEVSQLDPGTLMVSDAPGLFAAGEALDVDAPCGGYNLHWAWASGMVAGRAAVRYALDR